MAKRSSRRGADDRSKGGRGSSKRQDAQADDGGASFFDEETADSACRFIEQGCRFWQGEFAGQPFLLQPWQRDEIIRPLFGWKRRDPTVPRIDWPRRYREAFVMVAKGNGKTPIGAAIALLLLCWDEEPGAEVYSAAADRDQASIVYSDAMAFVQQSPELSAKARLFPGARRIVWPENSGVYRVLTSESKSKHGFRPLGIIFDELETQKDRRLHTALARGMRKRRQPLLVNLLTAGEYDPEALWWTEHEYAIGVRDGDIRDDSYLPVIHECDPEDDMADAEVLKKANPNHGVSVQIPELLDDWATALHKGPAAQAEFKQLHGNVAGESAACPFDMEAWKRCSKEPICEGPAFVGIDCSSKGDLTAAALWFPETNSVIVQQFMPSDVVQERKRADAFDYPRYVAEGLITTTEGNYIDQRAIRKLVKEWGDEYRIVEVGYDPRFVTDLPLWIEEDGFEVIEVRQGFALSESIQYAVGMIADENLRHGGNGVLRWNANNAVVRRSEDGMIKLTKKAERKRIDGLSAWLTAVTRAMVQYEGEAQVWVVGAGGA